MSKPARQKSMILAHLRVAPLTTGEALMKYGIYALSQRCGELRRAGYPIKSTLIEVREGTRVAEYRMEAQP